MAEEDIGAYIKFAEKNYKKFLNNVHVGDGDFTQIEKVQHTGMMVIGTYDNFTCGSPVNFLENINKHFCTKNELFFIEKTGHTYQQKHKKLLTKF